MIRIFFILLLTLNSCGYEIINKVSGNNYNIIEYELIGNNKINKILDQNFKKFQQNKTSFKELKIYSNSEITKKIASKNTAGNSTRYQIEIIIEIKVNDGKNTQTKRFKKNSTFSATGSQFELKQYEELLTNNMTSQIIIEINYFLKTIK